MPLSAIEDTRILNEIVGKVEDIADIGGDTFAVRIALSDETVGADPGQLINMLFGNTSLQDDVVLHDADIPERLVRDWGGPHFGLAGLRELAGAGERPLTRSAAQPPGAGPGKPARA